MDRNEFERVRKVRQHALQQFIDFILNNVEDPDDWKVQSNLNKIEELFDECF